MLLAGWLSEMKRIASRRKPQAIAALWARISTQKRALSATETPAMKHVETPL